MHKRRNTFLITLYILIPSIYVKEGIIIIIAPSSHTTSILTPEVPIYISQLKIIIITNIINPNKFFTIDRIYIPKS